MPIRNNARAGCKRPPRVRKPRDALNGGDARRRVPRSLPSFIAKLAALTQALSARKDPRRFGLQVTAASREGVDRRGTDTGRGTYRIAGTVKLYGRGCRTFYARCDRVRFPNSFSLEPAQLPDGSHLTSPGLLRGPRTSPADKQKRHAHFGNAATSIDRRHLPELRSTRRCTPAERGRHGPRDSIFTSAYVDSGHV